MKHTQGEWNVINEPDADGQETNYFAVTTGDVIICITGEELEINGETEANAKIIAAAPELLKACLYMIDAFNLDDKSNYTAKQVGSIGYTQTVIKKATE